MQGGPGSSQTGPGQAPAGSYQQQAYGAYQAPSGALFLFLSILFLYSYVIHLITVSRVAPPSRKPQSGWDCGALVSRISLFRRLFNDITFEGYYGGQPQGGVPGNVPQGGYGFPAYGYGAPAPAAPPNSSDN